MLQLAGPISPIRIPLWISGRRERQPSAAELDADELELLKTALSVLIGIEALIALRDVLRLDHEQARASFECAVRHMVRAARRHPTHDVGRDP
jgi:hypothetical protein